MAKQLKLPDYLTEQEQSDLLKQPNKKRTKTGLRNYCILLTFLQLGLRCAELLSLAVEDINWSTGEVKIRKSKYGKDRILWLNELVLDVLKQFIDKTSHPKTSFLFITLDGNKLNDRYIRRMVKRYGRKACSTKDVHPHLLRHTYATQFYRKTRDIRMLQKNLGHSDISTTMIYTHIVDDDREQESKNFLAIPKDQL